MNTNHINLDILKDLYTDLKNLINKQGINDKEESVIKISILLNHVLKKTNNFLEQARKHYLQTNQELKNDLVDTKAAISENMELLSSLEQTADELFSQKDKYLKIDKEYSDKKELYEKLNEIKNSKSAQEEEIKINISEIKKSIEKLDSDVKKTKEKLANLRNESSSRQKEFKSILVKLEKQKLTNEKLNQDIETKKSDIVSLKKTNKQKQQTFENLKNKLLDIKHQVGAISGAHEKNLEIWKKHFGSNDEIFSNLKNLDVKISEKIMAKKKAIEIYLNEYDEFLKKLIEINDSKSLEEIT